MIYHSEIAELFLINDYINLDDVLLCMDTPYDQSIDILAKTKHNYVTSGVIPLREIIDTLKRVKLYSEDQNEGDTLGQLFDVTYDRRVWERHNGYKIDMCVNKPTILTLLQQVILNNKIKIKLMRRNQEAPVKPILQFTDSEFIITLSEGSNAIPLINNFLSEIVMEVNVEDTREFKEFTIPILPSRG